MTLTEDVAKDKTIGFRGSESYRRTLQREALDRGIKVQKMLEEAVELYLSIDSAKVETVQGFIDRTCPAPARRQLDDQAEQKGA